VVATIIAMSAFFGVVDYVFTQLFRFLLAH
jgi:preprotein translocase subunit SecE